jgi:hypothetical protein
MESQEGEPNHFTGLYRMVRKDTPSVWDHKRGERRHAQRDSKPCEECASQSTYYYYQSANFQSNFQAYVGPGRTRG